MRIKRKKVILNPQRTALKLYRCLFNIADYHLECQVLIYKIFCKRVNDVLEPSILFEILYYIGTYIDFFSLPIVEDVEEKWSI